MKTYALPVSIIVLAIAIYFGMSSFNDGGGIGSVVVGNDYRSTQLLTADAASTSTLKFSAGSLGSVVVSNSSAAAQLAFYDNASTTEATSTMILLFTVDAEATEGTLQYDVEFNNGLLVDITGGFDGDVIVTYR